jgi:hypothetical protein
VRPEGLCQMKNSNDTIGNQTRDVPACSAVPQPTASPRAKQECSVDITKRISVTLQIFKCH